MEIVKGMNEVEIKQRESQPEQQQFVFAGSFVWLFLFQSQKSNCCRKTALCIGDQLLDFSVPELVRSQSTFSTDP